METIGWKLRTYPTLDSLSKETQIAILYEKMSSTFLHDTFVSTLQRSFATQASDGVFFLAKVWKMRHVTVIRYYPVSIYKIFFLKMPCLFPVCPCLERAMTSQAATTCCAQLHVSIFHSTLIVEIVRYISRKLCTDEPCRMQSSALTTGKVF